MEEKVKTKKNLNAITNEMKEICSKLFNASTEIPPETISILNSKLNSKIFKDLVKDSSLKISIKKVASDAPEKPKSAYLLFSNVKSAELRKGGTKFTIPELTKIVAEEWKKLSADNLKMYENMASVQREQYKKKINEYNAEMKRNDPNFIIKKPANKTAFSYFVEEEKIKQINNEEFVKADKKTQNMMLREIWKKMNNGTVEERKRIINYKKKATTEMDETLKLEEEIEKTYKRKFEEEDATSSVKKAKIVEDESKTVEESKPVEEKPKPVEEKKKVMKKKVAGDTAVVKKKKVVIQHIEEEVGSGDEIDTKMMEEFDMKIKPKSSM